LRAFETAARTLSFTGAADELNLTHGSISHQVNALEARLGVKLFEREARAVKLTELGKKYIRTPAQSGGKARRVAHSGRYRV
jgi:LysR family glycine cleavage system transcriptional activator